ncbi:protein NYNRIN-like [Eriocheir sinensis]|uniref:protein NYNRIN-like n=1 Tax=Eriocheir sinensis TaxID=95602 RepID=UPI0021C5FAC2|nr:protein NYNRIN-like [Eriocheir sinensis]
MQRTVNELAAQGVIERSDSPWSSAVVLVKKKDGTQRFCVDYRALNDVTVKDSYPLPRIDDTLDALVGARWFSTLDLKSGYHQVEMAEEDKPKTAFSFGQGLWQFNVMPFGLCNAPGCFERLMERVLEGLQWKTALVYIDDVIVFGSTFEEELERLEEVLQRLRKANLKLSPKKCSLFQHEVPFLGHVVSRDGVCTDPQKVAVVEKWPVPTNVAEVRSYLGLCTYYRRFVQDFASVAAPLHRLTRKGACFLWDEECQAAFDGLKKALVEAPVLPYPDPKLPYLLDTDASAEGVGAVLSQVKDVLAGVAEGDDKWRKAQREDADLAPIIQWLEAGGERPGWEAVAVESPATKCLVDQWETLRVDERGVLVKRWEALSGVGGDAWVVLVPRALRAEVLRELHAGLTSGHLGEKKTLCRLRQRFYWVGMRSDVSEWCRACDVCSAKKGPAKRNRAPLQVYCVGAPMERVAVDIAGPLPLTPRGNRYICVVMDYFTKWPEAYALPNHEAETVAGVLVNEFFTRFGVPAELHSDQGREFESRVFRECCELLGVRKTRTTPLHPQSDGMVERFNRTLAQQLAKYCGEGQEDWDVKLPAMLMAYRSAVHEAPDYTPARLII